MMDDPALDRELDKQEQQPIVIWKGIPCEVMYTYKDEYGMVWAHIKTLTGEQPWKSWTHGGWAYYDTTDVSEEWVKENQI